MSPAYNRKLQKTGLEKFWILLILDLEFETWFFKRILSDFPF
jgi:hypothetical protein